MNDKTIPQKWWFNFYIAIAVAIFTLLMVWIESPPSFDVSRGETEYTNCLQYVLKKDTSTIADAETMCADRKIKIDK